MARTIKVYRLADDGRRLAAGAFKAASEQELQLKWELHLATAAGGLFIAMHRGVQLGIGLASDAVPAPWRSPWLDHPRRELR